NFGLGTFDFGTSLICSNSTVVSEDCLYLNVWVSDNVLSKIKTHGSRAPVLVYFHGGSGTKGSSTLDIYHPSVFVALTGIVVVTVNYRLGIFGSFYLGDGRAQGNQAFLDQHLALKWTHENIAKFGGKKISVKINLKNVYKIALKMAYKFLFTFLKMI